VVKSDEGFSKPDRNKSIQDRFERLRTGVSQNRTGFRDFGTGQRLVVTEISLENPEKPLRPFARTRKT
jgi:hypothetical protein